MNKNEGTLKCMELKHIKRRAHLMLKKKLCDKICASKDKRLTYRSKHKIISCDAQHRPYNDCKEQH